MNLRVFVDERWREGPAVGLAVNPRGEPYSGNRDLRFDERRCGGVDHVGGMAGSLISAYGSRERALLGAKLHARPKASAATKRGVGHRPQATASIFDSTMASASRRKVSDHFDRRLSSDRIPECPPPARRSGYTKADPSLWSIGDTEPVAGHVRRSEYCVTDRNSIFSAPR